LATSPLKILVTGGAGYIGSHTVRQLLAAGHQVTVVDNLYSGHRWAVPPKADFHQLDAGDETAMSSLLRQQRTDAVIHFAGHIVVPESIAEPAKYYRNNVVGSLNLIRACCASGVGCFIFSSSAAVYGDPEQIPVAEHHPTIPINPYGRTKLITEWTLRDMALGGRQGNTGLKYVALRYFNVAGASLDGTLGQATPEATHLIKVACETATGQRPSISMFGHDYDTPDGTCVRDYIHVEDLAAAHLCALDHLQSGGESQVLNCGYGRGFSVRQVLDTVEQVSSERLSIVEAGRRAGDPANLVADNRAIREVLNWTPQYDDLAIICRTAYNWECRQLQ
jgi:UDP-glucose 4-epimerase